MSNTGTPAVPRGVALDPAGSGRQRWWDGTQWTDHFQEPYTPRSARTPRLPGYARRGTSGSTVWVWLIVALIGVGILPALFIDYDEVMRASLENSTGLPALTPQEGFSYLVSFLSIALWVLFAVLDYRALNQRGVPRPFHWAWMFFALVTPLVYLIGRSVVVRRRTGSGLAPLWVGVALTVLSIVVTVTLVTGPSIELFNELMRDPSLYE